MESPRTDPGPLSKFISANGVRLHYLEWPAVAAPLLIIHGNGHSGGLYAPLAARLSRSFRVLTLDLRGHGLSARPGSYTWADFRNDVTAFIDALGLQDLLLVAHSRGAGVALLAAAARPQAVRGVVAYEPTIPADAPLQSRIGGIVERTLGRRSRWPSRQEMYDHFRGRGAFKDWRDEFLQAYVQHCAIDARDGGVELANPVEVEASLYENMLDGSEWRGIFGCSVPVLAVHGDRGARAGDADPIRGLRPYFPNARVRLQADSSHSGPMEQPELFEQAIRDFAAELQ
jgi:pimeloyl-ACP methyl ester carboxylesterase